MQGFTLRDGHTFASSAAFPDCELDIANMFIGGCTLDRHWANVERAETNALYRLYEITASYAFDKREMPRRANIQEMLKADRWDIVTIQQGSVKSAFAEAYQPFADNLIGKIRELAPQAICHRYRFRGGKGVIRIDTTAAGLSRSIGVRNYSERINWGSVRKDLPTAWHGYNFVKGVNLRFDLRVKGAVVSAKNDAGVIELHIDGETAESAIGFSLISSAEAKARTEEAFGKGFDAVRAEAKADWRAALGRVRATFPAAGAPSLQARAFYGALYQSMIKPCDYGGGFVDFTTLWDTYRTEMPLVLSLAPERARPLALFMLGMIEANGNFPIQYSMTSELRANSGQAAALSVYVLTDAFFRGALTKGDYPRIRRAFVSEISSVTLEGKSSTFVLDYAGACSAAADVAKACGDAAFAAEMAEKSAVWRSVYDEKTGLSHKKGKFYEGDHRNYSFRPHPHMAERVALAGGAERFRALLDDFFCVGYEPDPDEPVQPNRRKGIADYMPEFTRERSLRPSEFVWRLAGRRTEGLDEVRVVAKARFRGDV